MKSLRIKITALLLLVAAIGQCLIGCPAQAEDSSTAQEIAQELADFFVARFEDPSVELDSNDDWAAADLAAWGYEFSDGVTARFEERLCSLAADEGAKNSVLARCVISMSALGLKGEEFEDASSRLAAAAETEKSIYTQPYILIALKQSGDMYESECFILRDKMLAAQLEGGGFNGFKGGPDADTTGPVLMALSFYCGDEDVAGVCALAAELVLERLDENGVIPRSSGSSACSAGVFIPGLCSVGAESGKAAEGLVSLYDSENMYSVNPNDRLSREQAMRGLIAALLGEGNIYDFGA